MVRRAFLLGLIHRAWTCFVVDTGRGWHVARGSVSGPRGPSGTGSETDSVSDVLRAGWGSKLRDVGGQRLVMLRPGMYLAACLCDRCARCRRVSVTALGPRVYMWRSDFG